MKTIKEFVRFFKAKGIGSVIYFIIALGLFIGGMSLVDPYDVKLIYRIGLVMSYVGVMMLSVLATAMGIYENEIKHKKEDQSHESVDVHRK